MFLGEILWQKLNGAKNVNAQNVEQDFTILASLNQLFVLIVNINSSLRLFLRVKHILLNLFQKSGKLKLQKRQQKAIDKRQKEEEKQLDAERKKQQKKNKKKTTTEEEDAGSGGDSGSDGDDGEGDMAKFDNPLVDEDDAEL